MTQVFKFRSNPKCAYDSEFVARCKYAWVAIFPLVDALPMFNIQLDYANALWIAITWSMEL